MSDKTNINENEELNSQNEAVANESATSETKVLKAEQVDSAELAYLIYARKYKRKLQAQERKKAKENAALMAQSAESVTESVSDDAEPKAEPVSEPVLEAEAASAQELTNETAPAAEETTKEEAPAAEEVPNEVAPTAEAESAEEPTIEADTESNNEESECENAPAAESMQKSWADDILDMVISIDVEAEKAAENADDGSGESAEAPNSDAASNPFNPAFAGYGAPTTPPQPTTEADDDRLVINIEEQIKMDENLINVGAVTYPEEAFDSIMQEKAALNRAIDEHYRACAMEMERLRQKHMYERMNATAKACAERSDEFKLLEEEEARYNREVEELSRRRDEAAKAYLDRKSELERIIGEYDARNEELADSGNAIQKIASGAADLTAAVASGIAQGGADREKIEAAKTPVAEAPKAPAKIEEPVAKAEEEKPVAAVEKADEKADEKPAEPHVVVPGAIDKARDDKELEKKLAEYRDERRKKADVELENLSAFIASAQKDISALDREYKELESSKPETDADNVVNVVGRLDVKRRTVEKMTDKLLACKEANAPEAVCRKHRDELTSAAAQYNAVVDEYKALTGHSLTPAQSDMADRILKGEEYRILPVITARREVVSKEDGRPVENVSAADAKAAALRVETVAGGEHQLTEEPAAQKEEKAAKEPKREERVAISAVAMTEKDIPKFYKEQKQKEAKLAERDRVLASLKPDSTEDQVVVAVERIGTQRELMASLSKDLKLAVRTKDKKRIRNYEKQLGACIDKYNKLADEYSELTGDSLTPADTKIPEYIVNGEKYKAPPVISYRKEAPDGTLLSDQKGAGTTCGAAYALIPEKERKALERRGIIEKTRPTAISGLPKREAKKKLKEEKESLKRQSEALAESAKDNAKKSKEEAKLSKRGTKEERAAHKAEALEYANKSAADDALAKEKAKTEKELKTLKDYEEYLLAREAAKQPRESVAAESAPELAALAAYRQLSKREKREKLREEKAALLAEAAACDEQAALDSEKAKEEKKLAKRGTRVERAEHKALAEEYSEGAKASAERAAELKKSAKALKRESDYEKYLEAEAARAEAKTAVPEATSLASHAEKPVEQADEPTAVPVLENYKKLSKREKREKLREEKAALLAEAKAYEEQAELDALRAKEEKKLAKHGTKAERAEHKSQSQECKERAEASSERAAELKKSAKALKRESDYEKYLEEKAANEAARKEASQDADVAAYESYLAEKQSEPEAAVIVPAAAELADYKKLSKREKREKLREEKAALLAEAKAYEEQASFDSAKAKEAKKLSKSGTKAERAEQKAQAVELAKSAVSSEERAKEAKNEAKALKRQSDFERYLEQKAARAEALREMGEAETLSAYDKTLAAKQDDATPAVALAPVYDELESFRKLSRKEKKARIKEEKLALLEEARLNEEEAKYAAQRAKEEKKLSKRGKRAERAEHKAEFERLSHESETLSASAKKNAKKAKEIESVKAYEKYLAEKSAEQKPASRGTEARDFGKGGASVEPYEAEYDKALERKAEKKDAERFAADHAIEMMALGGLSRKEKKALLEEERESLLESAEELERQAKVSEKQADAAKSYAKRGSRAEKERAKAEAKALREKSAEQKRRAKEAQKQVKALRSVSDYEKYVAAKIDEEAGKTPAPIPESAPVAAQKTKKSKYDFDTTLFDRSMSKRALRAEAKRRSAEYLKEAARLENEAKEEARLAKEERKLAKHAKRADRPVHASEADAYEARSRQLKERAADAKREAEELKELKTLKAFEAYNAKKEALAAEKNLAYKAEKEQARNDFADADKYIRHNRAAIEKFCREQSEYDEMMMKCRYETKAAALKSEIEIQKLHFGEKKGKYVKKYSALKKQLNEVKNHIPKAMKAENADNERYYEALRGDIDKMRLPKRVDKSDLAKIQIEIESLLKERDAVNRELAALYSSNKSADDSRNNTYERLKSATRGAKSAYNKQRKLANEVDSMDISLDEKEKIYDPMNRITQLNAEIKDLAYRLEREKLKGRAKRAVRSSIEKKKAERAHLEKKVKSLSNKARKKSYRRREERAERTVWIIILIAIIAAAVACYVFREQIVGLLGTFLPASVMDMIGSMFGGANNG